MGAGILPVTVHNGKIYFLFGKENEYEENPGWSDFGGGSESKEGFLMTAVREAGEEFTGFLGSDKDVKRLLAKYGTYNIDNKAVGYGTYRMHIFPMEYNELLPLYYNNNQRFLQKRLDPNVIKKSTIFEKAEIKWICIDELKKMMPKFRHYFRVVIDKILDNRVEIDAFARKALSNASRNNSNSNNKTRKRAIK